MFSGVGQQSPCSCKSKHCLCATHAAGICVDIFVGGGGGARTGIATVGVGGAKGGTPMMMGDPVGIGVKIDGFLGLGRDLPPPGAPPYG